MGREREQAILRDHLEAALTGRGSLVLIGGEAGIGKTALAEMLCREATNRGALVLVGHCYDLTDTPPYGPWVELFGRYQSDGGRPPPAAFAQRGVVGEVTSQAALFQQVKEFLTALSTRRPTVLLHDDLHWADPASLDLLRVLARDIALLPVLLLATYRADEVTRLHPLYALLSIFVREAHAERLDLRPLTENDLRELIGTHYRLGPTDTFRLIAYLQERAEGNPFFLSELLRTLEEERTLRATDGSWTLGDLTRPRVPPLLQQVIDGRLARLGEEAQTLLGVAAVIGQEVPLPLWASVTGVNEEALLVAIERTVAAHFIEEMQDGMHFRFVHALIREAIYEGISPARRRLLHHRIAELLAGQPRPDPDAVSYHFQQAMDDRAAEWLVTAGERAQRAYAWQTAADRFETALARMGAAADAGARGWLLFRCALCRRYAHPDQALAYLDAAAAAGDAMLLARTRLYQGLIRCYLGDLPRGIAEMRAGVAAQDALAAAGQPYTPLDAVDATNGHGTLALWLAIAGQFAAARALGEAHLAGAPPPLEGEGAAPYADAHHALGLVDAFGGRPDEAHAHLLCAAAINHAVGHRQVAVQVMREAFHYVRLSYKTDRVGERSREAAELAVAQAWLDNTVWLGERPEAIQPDLLMLEGRWAEIRATAAYVTESASLSVSLLSVSFISPTVPETWGHLARAQGDAATAWELVRKWMPDGPRTVPGSGYFATAIALIRVAVALALDADDGRHAREWLEAHDRWLDWAGAVLRQSEGQVLWARYHRQGGAMEQARVHATRALTHATEPRQPLALLASHRLLGELDTDAARFTDAQTHLDAALALADACAAPYERALTLLALAELHVATGNHIDAGTLLDEVHAICTPLGAKPALARVDALAERLVNTPNPSPAYPDDLTPREAEVLRLIAAGRSNREIAAALFISTYTVNRHVENVYRKIGVHGRADATTYAFRRRLT